MKVAMIAPTFLPALRANTLQVMKMADAALSLGHQVLLAVPGDPPDDPTRAQIQQHYGLQHDFPIHWLPRHPGLRSYDFGLRAVQWARRQQADLIYTRHPQAAAAGSLSGFPTILEVHDLPQGTLGPMLFRAFLRGRGAHRLVVITHALLQDLQSNFQLPPEPGFQLVLPDGVDLQRYTNLPDPLTARQSLQASGELPDLAAMGFTAGYTGHLYAGRGVRLILEMAHRLPQMNFLLVGGQAEDVRRLRKQVVQAGLANVHLTGFVPNADLPAYQAACDTLLMPYQRQVAASSGGDIGRYLSPMKLFEYLACQRPILCSDLPVLREILDESSAVLLPPDDPLAWVAALLALQAEPDRATLLAGRAGQLARQYTWEQRAARIFALEAA
jgi:glycosyltransferase involved in cell wall biosynthesis